MKKWKFLTYQGKEEKSCFEVAKINGSNKSFICDIVKREEEIRFVFAFDSQTAKIMATVHAKSL